MNAASSASRGFSMKYKAKSIIVGRMKREDKKEESYPCFVSMFDINNPHTSGEVPKKMLEFNHIHKVIFKGMKSVYYLLGGNDLVINNIKEVDIDAHEGHVHITIEHEE